MARGACRWSRLRRRAPISRRVALGTRFAFAAYAGNLQAIDDMSSDGVETARLRYRAAYDAYQTCARRVAQKLESGADLMAQDLDEEAEAIERLAHARRMFLDAVTRPE